MSGDRYKGRIDHMASVAALAGFAGFEPEVIMLGSSVAPDQTRRVLDRAGIQLASLVYVADWKNAEETAHERAEADRCIDFVQEFPGAILLLVQMPGDDRANLGRRQANALACINAVASRAARAGARASFHANSPAGSIFRTPDDYEVLLTGLDPKAVGFTPDVGHLAAGGMDPLEIIRRYRDRVDHVHFKDIDAEGRWVATGNGMIDFSGVVSYLRDTGYSGWIVLEDESPAAESDPDAAVRRNGAFVRAVLEPLLMGQQPSPTDATLARPRGGSLL